MALKNRMHDGRLALDETTEFVQVDPGDCLDPADRAALHQALLASQEDLEAGRLLDADEVLTALRPS